MRVPFSEPPRRKMAESKLAQDAKQALIEETRALSAEERMKRFHALKARGIAIFRAQHPELSLDEALDLLQRRNGKGRRPSFVNEW